MEFKRENRRSIFISRTDMFEEIFVHYRTHRERVRLLNFVELIHLKCRHISKTDISFFMLLLLSSRFSKKMRCARRRRSQKKKKKNLPRSKRHTFFEHFPHKMVIPRRNIFSCLMVWIPLILKLNEMRQIYEDDHL